MCIYIYIYIHTYIYIYIYTHTLPGRLPLREGRHRGIPQHPSVGRPGEVLMYSWMNKPTRSDSYPNPLRLTECLLSLTEAY